MSSDWQKLRHRDPVVWHDRGGTDRQVSGAGRLLNQYKVLGPTDSVNMARVLECCTCLCSSVYTR